LQRAIDPFLMSRFRIDDETIDRLLTESGDPNSTLSDLEVALEQSKADMGQRLLDSFLDKLEPEDDTPKPCPRCNKNAFVRRRKVGRHFCSRAGDHTLYRNYHYCERCRSGFYPRDAQLGLPAEGELTLELEKRVLDFAVNGPYEECAQRWEVHYGRPFPRSSSGQSPTE
jgi:hypothetical protein